jgi:hypothetical protein
MPSPRRRNTRNSGQQQQREAAERLDELSEFEEFRREVLPELRRMMYRHASAKEIAEFTRARMLARAATLALTSPDEKVALSALKEVLDRGDGKATETKKIEMNQMSDAELDALIKAELEAAGQ